MQEKLTDIWKENILEDLEGRLLEYEMIGEFLVEIKKKFGREDSKSGRAQKIRVGRKNYREICIRI